MGSIPFGYLVAKTQGVDIRKLGSGNIGGTNVRRNLGFKWGFIVGLLDFSKSYLPSILARHLWSTDWQILLISLMPVIGHIFPIWIKFKGGKGVATIFGIIAAYLGLPIFLAGLTAWYLIVKIVQLMSLVNLCVGLLLPFLLGYAFHSYLYASFGLVLCLLIWWSHRENIQRLLAGTENPANY
jgi:glycerol-3-phosphate acyltransferase PlsY